MALQADPFFGLAVESGLVPYKWSLRAYFVVNVDLQPPWPQGIILWRKRKRKRERETEKEKEKFREKERR